MKSRSYGSLLPPQGDGCFRGAGGRTPALQDFESHKAVLARLDAILVANPDIDPGTPQGVALELLISQIEEYESQIG